MLTGFQNSFISRVSNEVLALNVPTHLKRVDTLFSKVCVLKNRHTPEMTDANSDARLSHSKQLLQNIHPMMLASFYSLTKRL